MAASPSEALAQRRATYQDVLDARRTRWPRSSTGRSTRIPGQRYPLPGQARCWVGRSGLPTMTRSAVRAGGGSSTSPSCTWGEDIVVPDLAGWRRERMPELPDAAYFTLAPDWVCEVLSPSTRRVDLQGKRPVYAREGVGHLWLVDPTDRTLEAFELRDGEWVLIACAKDDEPVSIRPFDAITFSLGDLWP